MIRHLSLCLAGLCFLAVTPAVTGAGIPCPGASTSEAMAEPTSYVSAATTLTYAHRE
jgi:hypothetical protein